MNCPRRPEAVWATVCDPATWDTWFTIHEQVARGAAGHAGRGAQLTAKIVHARAWPTRSSGRSIVDAPPNRLRSAAPGWPASKLLHLHPRAVRDRRQCSRPVGDFEGALIKGALGKAVEKDGGQTLDKTLDQLDELARREPDVMADEHAFDDSRLNQWTDEDRFEVTRERLAEYAAATNDPDRRAPQRRRRAAGVRNRPGFPGAARRRPSTSCRVEAIPRVVHGEQDFHFHRPIHPGDKLVSRGKMIGYRGPARKAPVRRSCSSAARRTANWSTSSTSPRSCAGSTTGKAVGELSPATSSTSRCATARR